MSLMVFFSSYCSIIYFSINNIFLILLTSYPSVLPSRTLLSFFDIFTVTDLEIIPLLGNTSWHRRSINVHPKVQSPLCPGSVRMTRPADCSTLFMPGYNKHNRIHSDSSGQKYFKSSRSRHTCGSPGPDDHCPDQFIFRQINSFRKIPPITQKPIKLLCFFPVRIFSGNSSRSCSVIYWDCTATSICSCGSSMNASHTSSRNR